MAVPEIRRASMYIANNKLAELESSSMNIVTNGEQAHMQDGVGGISIGNPEVELTANTIRPVNPNQALLDLENLILTQGSVTCGYKAGNRFWTATFKVMSYNMTSDSRTGTLKGVVVLRNADNPVLS